jgi:hypothetical protein
MTFAMVDLAERLPVVGELEKDITADAEPVSLAAAGI